MATWPASADFAARVKAHTTFISALKSVYDLPSAELRRTAGELESECLEKATSKDEYIRLVAERKAAIKLDVNAEVSIQTTTGESEEPGAEIKTVGKYKVVYHARSLNSVIYRQKEPECDPSAVLKIVAISDQIAPHDIVKEAELLRMAADSSRVIDLLSSEQIAGGLLALRLPYMRYDLSSLAAQDVLSDEQKRRHLHDMFSALADVHALGVVHRDVKPSNVLLDNPDGPAYLTDFGISWHDAVNVDEAADGKITDVGTGCYRAPEVLFGCHNYGTKLDMWAAGCTMAEVLVGGGKTLFDAGPVTRDDFLGSDLTLLNSLFQTRGTPTDDSWPEAKDFRDWGKISFKEFPAKTWAELLPGIANSAREVVEKLVVYESAERLDAASVRLATTLGRAR